ncbi:MAG: 23S rRNA (adenine(2503)-C(2))-methyltransferase RlmN [Acidobacteriales bacterium]|nr:23S rRNA (adenine(2503)-C(2))-methyltransferase RlmN [Terriglobales bacterium]
MGQALVGLDREELRAVLGASEPPYRARQLYESLYAQRVTALSEATSLPSALRERLTGACRVGWPEVTATFTSTDGTRRTLLRLDDGRTVEAVWMPEESRDTVCISTQVGCPVDCAFCLTARMGLERSLTTGEILGQVAVLARAFAGDQDARRLNIVMMGMGEPLLNLANVVKATRILTDAHGMGISPRRVTVSTSGIIPRMAELGREPVRPKLAISLNASTQEQRLALMPITRKYPLAELMEACRAYPLRSWERLTFEYVLLKGVNDTEQDARRVVTLIGQLRCKVNLIALNPGPDIPFETPSPERVLAFQDVVRRSVPCFIRKPRGRDVYAACGQLKRMTA